VHRRQGERRRAPLSALLRAMNFWTKPILSQLHHGTQWF
jgi:hypothetical protein